MHWLMTSEKSKQHAAEAGWQTIEGMLDKGVAGPLPSYDAAEPNLFEAKVENFIRTQLVEYVPTECVVGANLKLLRTLIVQSGFTSHGAHTKLKYIIERLAKVRRRAAAPPRRTERKHARRAGETPREARAGARGGLQVGRGRLVYIHAVLTFAPAAVRGAAATD